jgi:hypothetical protein
MLLAARRELQTDGQAHNHLTRLRAEADVVRGSPLPLQWA